jgi:hypothetical protein
MEIRTPQNIPEALSELIDQKAAEPCRKAGRDYPPGRMWTGREERQDRFRVRDVLDP